MTVSGTMLALLFLPVSFLSLLIAPNFVPNVQAPTLNSKTCTFYTSGSDCYATNESSTSYDDAWIGTTGYISAAEIGIGCGQRLRYGIYHIERTFLYFDTSSLGSVTIVSAYLYIYIGWNFVGTNFSITVQNGQPTCPHDPAVATDYSQSNYADNGGQLLVTSSSIGWSKIYLNSDGISWINMSDWTKLVLRSDRDIFGIAPTGDEYVSFYSSRVANGTFKAQLVLVTPTRIIVPDDYPTVQEAINHANEGDTIYVRAGTYSENLEVNKTLSLVGENRETTIIDANNLYWYVIRMESTNNVTITGFTLQNGIDAGIWLYSCNNSKILENNLQNVTGWEESGGVVLWLSFNCTISRNNFENLDRFGVSLYCCENCTVYENRMNKIADSGVHLYASSNCLVAGNDIDEASYGIHVYDSSECKIFNNSIDRSEYSGIHCTWNGSCIFSENNISNSQYGLYLHSYVYNSSFYHNNFLNNTNQVKIVFSSTNVWNNSHPSGGNYWSDYNGTDLYNGPYQNETGSDGIGDTPYVIDANNIDHYPLMNPWTPPDIAATNITTYIKIASIIIQRNIFPPPPISYSIQINVTVENEGNKIEAFNITVYANDNPVGNQTNVLLRSGNFTTLNFQWNITGFAKGNYTIWAYISPIFGEVDVADNKLSDGWIIITIPGDVNGDFKADIIDLVLLIRAFGSYPSHPRWNSNIDINCDGKVDIQDLVLLIKHFGEHYS